MKIEVFSDGSATVVNKPGGWAWVMVIDGKFFAEDSGHLDKATNNDAELISSIKGLDAVLKYLTTNPSSFPDWDFDVTLKSDSKLVLGWASGEYSFKQTEKLWLYEDLRRLMGKLKAKTEHTPGHAGIEWNERCDKLANAARLGKQLLQEKEEAKASGNSLIGKKKEGIVCFWYKGKLKVIDFSSNICEDYSKELHGKRGSLLEIREDKIR